MPNFTGADLRDPKEKHGERPSICDWGVKTDGMILVDTEIEAGFNIVVSASGLFVPADTGKTIWIEGAGVGGLDLLTTISDYVSATSVLTTDAASSTVTAALTRYGTDRTTQFNEAFAESLNWQSGLGFRLQIPRGRFLTTDSIILSHNLCLDGQGWSYHVFGTRSPSLVMCCADVPVFKFEDTADDGLSSCVIAGVSFNGTRRSGSKGIYTAKATGLLLRDCAFNHFGDQAVHLEGGIFDNRLYNLHVTGSCLVRSRTDWVGCIDVAQSDLMIENCMISASCSHNGVNPVPEVDGSYGDGFIAALCVRLGNSWISDCMFHHAQVGVYVSPLVSDLTFVNVRADDNQGHGWVIDGGFNHFLGCRAFADGQDADGTYDAFLINGSNNDFSFCQINNFGYAPPPASPLYNRYKHAFETTNDAATAPNRFLNNHIASYACTEEEYKISGTQVNNPNLDLTGFNPIGRKTVRCRSDFSVWDDAYEHLKTDAPTDEGKWRTRLNYGVGFSQLLHALETDDMLTETVYLQIDRTGAVVNFVRFPNCRVEVTGGDLRLVHDTAELKFTTAAGVPRQILAAYGGTGPGNGTPSAGDLLVGNFSSEWSRLAAGGGFLYTSPGSGVLGYQTVSLAAASAQVTDTLPLANGGLGATTAAGGRITLDVYSKSDIDGMFAARDAAIAGKATAGAATGVTSAHSHTQT